MLIYFINKLIFLTLFLFTGEPSSMNSFLTQSLLVGLLKSQYKNINLVNAGLIGKEAGAQLTPAESTLSALTYPLTLSNAIQVKVTDLNDKLQHTLIGG